jgi:hypothetical protein
VLKKINDNACVIGLLNIIGISKTFNVVDLYECFPNTELNSRTSFSKMGETTVEQLSQERRTILKHEVIVFLI